jgi:hypothetical protein
MEHPGLIAAPGEGVVTTYPWGTYAWRWERSAPHFTAGTAALMLGTNGGCTHSATIPLGLAAADYIGDVDMGFGRLDSTSPCSRAGLFTENGALRKSI